jgi:hypothetical protein
VASFLHAIRIARAAVFAAAALFFFPTRFAAAARADEPPAEVVGVIEGEAISVTGPMSVEVVQGEARLVLRNGSDVLVKSGTARIDLVEGGQITICGPAHLSVLKSGGSLTVALDTVALDSGTIHVRIEHEPALTIYTAQIQAHPVAIADGPQDVFVGFQTLGAMCIHAKRGSVRIEQQLTGQSVLIPETHEVLLLNGQPESLYTSAGRCACEMQIAKLAQPRQPEISRLASAKEVRRKTFDAKPNLPTIPAEKPAVKEDLIYQVLVPPPIHDANVKVQPEINPQSVEEVARRTPEQKQAAVKPAKVITDPIHQVLVPLPVYDASAKVQPETDPQSVAESARRAPEQKQAAVKPAKVITDPVHQVLVPPPVYDASTKVQPEIDPQSVVEAARRAREQKQAAVKPAKVVTDDSVKHVTPTRSGPARRAPAAASPASDATGAPAAAGSAATPGPRDEKPSKEVAALKDQIKQAQGDLDLLRREQAFEQDTYYSNPDYTHDTAAKSKLDGMKQQIGDKQQELDRLKARLGELGAAPEARARDMRPDRAVAIKILPVQLSSDACTQAVLRAVLPDESSYRGHRLASYDRRCRVRCLALQGVNVGLHELESDLKIETMIV